MEPPRSDDTAARTYPLGGMPNPRWDRSKPIYPTHVHSYLDCPFRCRLEYVDKIPYERIWNRKMEVGNALHKVMEDIAEALRLRKTTPSLATRRSEAERLLPACKYDDLDDRAEDIDNILKWAEHGEDYIVDAAATILRIERYYPRHWDRDEDLGPLQFAAKADLVMNRQDRYGQYIEIIDYKTGYWQRNLDFAPALSRISHKPQIKAAVRKGGFPRVMFTYLWLAREETIQIDLTREYMYDQWRELKHVLMRMVHDDDWHKQPDPKGCRHCPYYNTECVPFPSGIGPT